MRSPPTPWTHWPFRVVVTTATALLVDQAVLAGQFLSGTFTALQTHRENATAAGIAVLAAAVAAIPIRWPGRGPLWPALACLGLFGLLALQIAVGFARLLTVHVPLGVSIIALAVLLTVWAWRPHARPDARPEERVEASARPQRAAR
jgi:heme A synthase